MAAANGVADDDRWHRRKDGTNIWLSGVTLSLREADGTIVAFAKVARDRTDLRTQIDALNKRIQAAAVAERERSRFLKTLGHELRNPLGPLTTTVALLRRNAGDTFHGPLAVIERQLDAMKRLSDDLTDLTRIEVGRVVFRAEPLKLQEFLHGIVEGFQLEAKRRGLTLWLLAPSVTIELVADRGRLQQIFANLLQNALKYTPAGGTVWVKATIEANHAVVRVEDNGVGIAPDVLPRIFELFTQENPDAVEADGGLGIGLALVSELVRLHNGVVEVRSAGKGNSSEFTVRLPLSQRLKEPSG